MKKLDILIPVLLFALWGTAFGEVVPEAGKVLAALLDARGNRVGTAELSETMDGVVLKVEVAGLSPGKHGIHLHAVGKCEPPDFSSAGSHLNPLGKKHGLKNPDGHHAGDLPNLEVGPDGTGKLMVILGGMTLEKGVPNSLYGKDGLSLVIHAGPDDEVTDPAGNSGSRIACGVIP